MFTLTKPGGGQCDGMKWMVRAAPAVAVAAVAAHDLLQRRHALLRNFPVVGHARYWLEAIGPELRQYLVAGNDEERPFSRDQRRWVYASSKLENNYFGFGTDNDVEHTRLPHPQARPRSVEPSRRSAPHAGQEAVVPCAKVLGGRPPTAGRVPPGLRRQHLRHELRLAVGPRRRGAEPRGRAGGLPAEHRRGRHVAHHRTAAS